MGAMIIHRVLQFGTSKYVDENPYSQNADQVCVFSIPVYDVRMGVFSGLEQAKITIILFYFFIM